MISQCFLGEADPGMHRKSMLVTEAARPQDHTDSSLPLMGLPTPAPPHWKWLLHPRAELEMHKQI